MKRLLLLALLACVALCVALPAGAQTLIGNITVGAQPLGYAYNPNTNRIYIANYCGNDPACGTTSPGTVSVIDGATDTVVATITVGLQSEFDILNLKTNTLYVSNRKDSTVTVINASTNAVITTLKSGIAPHLDGHQS